MQNNALPFDDQWRPKALIGFHLLALVLLASWMLPGVRPLWQAIDQSVFFALNGSLADNPAAQRFWALMNTRIADLAPAVLILISLTFPLVGFRGRQLHGAFIGFVILMVVMWPVRESLYEIAVGIGISGDSPSLVLEPAHRLSQLVPDINAKDHAGHSFPGDHAAVLWTWAGFLIFALRTPAAWLSLLVAFAFMLPRMVGGAHWFTDNIVGGISVALVTLSWAFHTPLLFRLSHPCVDWASPWFYRLGQLIPGLSLLPYFKADHSE